MKFTKESIDGIRFISIKKKYYLSEQVDNVLDELANEAAKLDHDIASIKEKAEKYDTYSNKISAAMIEAQKQAESVINTAKAEAERIITTAKNESDDMIAKAMEERGKLLSENKKIIEATSQLRAAISVYVNDISEKLSTIEEQEIIPTESNT